MKITIADIQHGSVHDGPGIRVTVFFKGCNMRCLWCHNPETVYPRSETLFAPENCIGCGRCDTGCFAGAKVVCGREMTPGQIFSEIEIDIPYFGADGGVTLSGGEPLLQAEGAMALLSLCRARGIGTAIETNLHFQPKIVEEAARLCGLVICDLKTFDPNLHKRYTGADNMLVKKNLEMLAKQGINMLVRTPVIPGVNDTPEEIGSIATFLSRLPGVCNYELLTYHPLGIGKAQSGHFQTKRFEKPTKDLMKRLADAAHSAGLTVKINGVRFIE